MQLYYIAKLEKGIIARPNKRRLTLVGQVLGIPLEMLYTLADYRLGEPDPARGLLPVLEAYMADLPEAWQEAMVEHWATFKAVLRSIVGQEAVGQEAEGLRAAEPTEPYETGEQEGATPGQDLVKSRRDTPRRARGTRKGPKAPQISAWEALGDLRTLHATRRDPSSPGG